jgi:predicted nicotinamide N-methyase
MAGEIDGVRLRELTVEVAPGLHITILLPLDPDQRLEAALTETDADPYAAVLWPAAFAVAAELPALVRPGMRVLDLGAGTGLAALTAARLGARASALDHDPFALRLIDRAARLQGLAVETQLFDLYSEAPLPPADLVAMADLLYEPALARAAGRRVLEQVTRGGIAVVGDPGRRGRVDFLAVLAASGIRVSFRTVRVRMPGEDRPTEVGVLVVGPDS